MESKSILRGVDGNEIIRYGTTMMLVQFGDRTFKIRFEVVDCHNPLLSVSEMENHAFTVHLADGERYVQRKERASTWSSRDTEVSMWRVAAYLVQCLSGRNKRGERPS